MKDTEFFPPTEDELVQMIKKVDAKMNNAENLAEYQELNKKLEKLQKQHAELILKNQLL